jgi:hypothetical protein
MVGCRRPPAEQRPVVFGAVVFGPLERRRLGQRPVVLGAVVLGAVVLRPLE